MNMIVAAAQNNAIGKDNKLLINLPTDMKFFKETTIGKVVVMGEKTFMSLPFRPLKGRTNIVLSNNANFKWENTIVVNTVDQLLHELKKYPTDEIFICGGASVYKLMMPLCKKIYLTRINFSPEADTFINAPEENGFSLKVKGQPIEENGVTFSFDIYEK